MNIQGHWFAQNGLFVAAFFAFSLLPFVIKSQDLTGVWQGVIYQPASPTAPCFPTSFFINQTGTTIAGQRKTRSTTSATAFVEGVLGGSVVGGKLQFSETAFSAVVHETPFEWCMIDGELTYDPATDRLKGPASGISPSGWTCPDLTVELFRLRVISPLVFCEAGGHSIQVAGQNVRWYADEARTNLIGSGISLPVDVTGPLTVFATQTTSVCNFESPAAPVSVGLTDLAFSKIETTAPGCGPGLGGKIEVAAAGGVVPYQFQINNSAFQNALIFNDLAAGSYTLTVRDGMGCEVTESVALVPPGGLSVIAFGSAAGCDGTNGTVAATVTGGAFPYDYKWSNGWFSRTQGGLGAGVYSLTVTDFLGCSAVAEAEVKAIGGIVLSPAEDTLFSAGGAVQLNVNANRLLTEIEKIVWSPNDFLNCDDCLDPAARPDSTTFFEILVIDTAGCEGRTGILVIVKRPDPALLFVPNVFSPNFDGDNDLWSPLFSANVELVEVAVFDRWGGLVFRSENPADGWDGTWKGKNLDAGAYPFFVKYRANGLPEVRLKEGSVTIVR